MKNRPHLRLVRDDEEAPEAQVDEMLDLQAVPPSERWLRISAAVRRLDAQRGSQWRLKLLLRDAPEEASQMPVLVAQLGQAGLRYNTIREPGGVQGTVLAPGDERNRPGALPVAA